MNIVPILILLVVLIPVLWIGRAIFYVFVLDPYRKKTSYLVSKMPAREPGDGFCITYYEGGKELYFFGDDYKETIYLPNEELWRRSTMPDFFRERYGVIVERLKRDVDRYTALKVVDDYNKVSSILYADHSNDGHPKRIVIWGAP